jgi:hypothetical protein
LETEARTAENDNDKSLKYFKDPSDAMKRKGADMRATQEDEGNLLIDKLRRQTAENKDKNDLIVKQKTLLNDQVWNETAASNFLLLLALGRLT